MKSAIVNFSETGDRWDVGFHMLRLEMKERTDVLEQEISRDEALMRLERVPLRFKSGLLPLGWGSSNHTLIQRTIDPIQQKYPHLCMAILELAAPDAIRTLGAEISMLQQSISALELLCEPSAEADDETDAAHDGEVAEVSVGLQAGWLYPFVDPDQYWDEDDAETYDIEPEKRFSYARIPTDAHPGDCYILDAWIVDDEGRMHPGYDACPVPVRKEDLDLERGRPLAGETPKPKTIFDSGWLRR